MPRHHIHFPRKKENEQAAFGLLEEIYEELSKIQERVDLIQTAIKELEAASKGD